MVVQLQPHLFVSDIKKYVSMLDSWLGGKVLRMSHDAQGEPFMALYSIDSVTFSIQRPLIDSTNTPSKVKGSTCVIRLFVENKEQVDALYKKGLALGFFADREQMTIEAMSMYLADIQDTEGQWWHIATMLEKK